MQFKNKVVVVTGASTGIGRAIATEFAKEGAKLIITARSLDGLNKTLENIKKSGSKGESIPVNLRKIEEIKELAKKIKNKYEKIDVLVNVAGVWHSKDKAFSGIDFENYETEEILAAFEVGITAPTVLSHELLPLMKKGSKIINISGTFESGAKGWLPYYVSKKAIEYLTIGLSQELRNKQIQVNCISPSDVATEAYKKFFPEYATEENALKPQDVAKLAMFIASGDSDHITGQIITIKQKLAK